MLRQIPILNVFRDPDHLKRLLAHLNPPTDWAPFRPIGLRHGFVDDGHGNGRWRVAALEIPSRDYWNLQDVEVMLIHRVRKDGKTLLASRHFKAFDHDILTGRRHAQGDVLTERHRTNTRKSADAFLDLPVEVAALR